MKATLTMRTILHALLATFTITTTFAQSPIVFQPSAGLNDGTDEGGLYGGKDTWVYDGDPTTNYGNSTTCYSMPLTSCNNTNVRGFLKFDVSTLPAEVDSVHLAVDFFDQTTYCISNCEASFSFNYVDAAWNEMTMTWNDQPTPSEAFAGPFAVAFPEVGGERHYDVTDAYLAWRSGSRANHGFAIVPLDGSCNNAAIFFGFYSSDDTSAAHEPARLLVYVNTIGIQEPDAWSGLRIGPNPATEAVFIEVPSTIGSCHMELMDGSGQLVLQQRPTLAQRTMVPLHALDAGVYVLRFSSADHGILTRRLVKQ